MSKSAFEVVRTLSGSTVSSAKGRQVQGCLKSGMKLESVKHDSTSVAVQNIEDGQTARAEPLRQAESTSVQRRRSKADDTVYLWTSFMGRVFMDRGKYSLGQHVRKGSFECWRD